MNDDIHVLSECSPANVARLGRWAFPWLGDEPTVEEVQREMADQILWDKECFADDKSLSPQARAVLRAHEGI